MTKTAIIENIKKAMTDVIETAAKKGISAAHPQIKQYQEVADKMSVVIDGLSDLAIEKLGWTEAKFAGQNKLQILGERYNALKSRGYIG